MIRRYSRFQKRNVHAARIIAIKQEAALRFMRAVGRPLQPTDPCILCRYQGICDPDDCAMHNFELDVNVSPLNLH
jgi:hypothetical protein